MSFPKPKRVKSPTTLRRYHDRNPSCEVESCWQPAMPTPHHLTPVSLGGGDESRNLLSLCVAHHVGDYGWHVLGALEWFRRHKDQLEPDARAKVVQALSKRKEAA